VKVDVDQSKKKKMDVFSKELLRVGTLKGFLHFHCYLRGREELVVTIPKENKEEIAQVGIGTSRPSLPRTAGIFGSFLCFKS
jgi:hypothetical protein